MVLPGSSRLARRAAPTLVRMMPTMPTTIVAATNPNASPTLGARATIVPKSVAAASERPPAMVRVR